MILSNNKIIVWYIVLSVVLLLSFGIETNGLLLFFGVSVWAAIGIIIAVCKVYIAIIDKRNRWVVYLLSCATVLFMSLDTYTHYINSKGINEDVVFKVQETDRRIESAVKELKSLETEEKRLLPDYGSATKRNLARKELNKRKDLLNESMESLADSKVKLLKQTSFNIPFNVMKFIISALVEVILLYLISYPPEARSVNKSSITNGQVSAIKEVMSKPLKEEEKYLYNKGENEELFYLLLKLGLIFIYRGKYYTYSQEIEALQTK